MREKEREKKTLKRVKEGEEVRAGEVERLCEEGRENRVKERTEREGNRL